MSTPVFRLARPGEEAQLRALWCQAYPGEDACADAFFQTCYCPGCGVVAELDRRLCSAIYLIEGYTLRGLGGREYSAAYLFALGTPPQWRGLGLGGKTIWRSGVEGYLRGDDFVCFFPASLGLADWYHEVLGTTPVFFRRTAQVTAGETAPDGTLEPVAPAEYAVLRRQLLAGWPHAESPTEAVQLQGDYCRLGDGGLYRICVGGRSGICALDREGDALTFRELLAPEGDPTALARLALARLGCRTAEVRTPAFWHEGFGRVESDCVLIPGGGKFPKTENPPYWGLVMD